MTHRSYCSLLAIFAVVLALGGLSHADLLNGSFEAGLASWDDSLGNGSVQVLEASDILPAGSGIAATDGRYFAMVGNGPADVGNDGVADTGVLFQDFTVDTYGGNLSFDYQFFTFEFTGDFWDPAFDDLDFFEIWLTPTVGPATLIDSGDVSELNFSLMPDIYDTPDGTGFAEEQPALSYSAPIAAGDYRLEFIVGDDPFGFGDIDSVLFVDSVLLVENDPPPTHPVPEPGTMALVCFAGAFAAWRLRKRKSA